MAKGSILVIDLWQNIFNWDIYCYFIKWYIYYYFIKWYIYCYFTVALQLYSEKTKASCTGFTVIHKVATNTAEKQESQQRLTVHYAATGSN